MRNSAQRSTKSILGKFKNVSYVTLSKENHSLKAFLVGTEAAAGMEGMATRPTLRGQCFCK